MSSRQQPFFNQFTAFFEQRLRVHEYHDGRERILCREFSPCYEDKTLQLFISIVGSLDGARPYLYDLIDKVNDVVDGLKCRFVDAEEERHYYVRQRRIRVILESVQQWHTMIARVIRKYRG